MPELLIRNARLLADDAEGDWLLVADGRVEAVGRGAEPAAEVVHDSRGALLVPGLIDIHCPEFWGFVFFTDHGEACAIPEDEIRKLYLRKLYYAQYAYFAAHGTFTSSFLDLNVSPAAYPVTIETTSRTFFLSCPSENGGSVCLRSDSYTYVD